MKILKLLPGILLILTSQLFAQQNPLPDPIQLMKETQKSYEALSDYTSTFIKQQRVRDRLRKQETIFIKFKKPFSIYMKWTDNPDKGKEVIYVEGKNDNKIVAHLGGLLGLITPTTFRLDPNSALAMGGNLKPITQAGLGNMIDSLIRIFHLANENGDLKATCDEIKIFNGRKVYVVKRHLPDKKKYPNSYAEIYVDTELKLPIYYAAYDKENNLLEKYEYLDLKINVGLTEADFDKNNNEYRYPIF